MHFFLRMSDLNINILTRPFPRTAAKYEQANTHPLLKSTGCNPPERTLFLNKSGWIYSCQSQPTLPVLFWKKVVLCSTEFNHIFRHVYTNRKHIHMRQLRWYPRSQSPANTLSNVLSWRQLKNNKVLVRSIMACLQLIEPEFYWRTSAGD